MKRFYKFLMPLVAMVAMALPVNVMAQDSCSITIVGADSYGDGWNNGSLAVKHGSTTLATVSMTSGSDVTAIVPVASGDTLSFVWTSGSFDSEVSFTIYGTSGEQLYTVSSPTAGTVYTINGVECPSCMPPSNFTASATDDVVDFSWTDANGDAWEVVYGLEGFDPENATDVESASSTTLQISGVEDGIYDAYVRTDCGGEYSVWIGPAGFSVGVTLMNMATTGSDTLRTCNAIIYDNGGPTGQYSSSCDATLVIFPSDDQHAIKISGTSETEGSYDYLTIYSGVGTSGEMLFCDNVSGDNSVHAFGPFLTTGAFTVVFHSDPSIVKNGFQINVSCEDLPDCIQPETFVVGDVDSSSVSFHWTDENGSAWTIGYGPTGFTLGDTNTLWADFTDTLGTITGLTPNTVYDFYLMAVCSDDSSWTRSVTVRTACAPIHALPFVEDFSNSVTGSSNLFDPCWSVYNTYSTSYSYPYVYSASNNYLYMYLYSSSDMNSMYGYAMLPELGEELWDVDMELSFDIWGSATTSYGRGVIVALFDSTSTPYTPVFDTVAIINPTATSQSTAQTVYASLVGHSIEGKRLGFYYCNQSASATGTTYYTYIDNVSLHEAPQCFVPENLTANFIGTDTLDLSWDDLVNEGASYWVEYRPAGAADTVLWTGVEVSDTNVILEPLSANTLYDISVRALCGGEDTSFALTGSFRTACGAITALPWTENFDQMTVSSTSMIPCWVYMGGGYVATTSSYSVSGNGLGFYPSGSSTNDHILVLPDFDTATSGLELSFWIRPESITGNSGSFSVGYVTNTTQANTFVEVLNLESTQMTTTFTQYEVTFAGAPDDARIALRHNVNSTAWYWFIDNLDVHPAPVCNHPSGLTVLGSTATEATIGWGGTEDATYRVWFSTGNTCDTATDSYVDMDSTHYTVTGLTPSTYYTAVVATICEDGSLTTTVTVTFLTPEMGVPVPYATGFEATDDTAWVFINGTQTNQWVLGSAAGNPGSSIYISNDNGASNAYTITSTTNVYAYKTFDMNVGQYAITFDWRAYGESTYDYLRAYLAPGSVELTAGTLYSGIGTTGTPAGWISLDGNSKMNLSSGWQTQEAVAIIPANGTYKLVFVWHNDLSAGTMPPAAVDNINISLITCPQPTDLTADSVSTNSIDVHWTPGDYETVWNIRIDGGAWQTVNTTPAYQFTNLASGTNHEIEVRAECAIDDISFVTRLAVATLCAPISSLPYTENFNNWGTGTSVHAPMCYYYGSDYSSTYPYINASYNHSGSNGGAMYMYNYDASHTKNTWFALPELDTNVYQANQLQVVFNLYVSTSSYSHMVRVGVNDNPTATGATWVDTVVGIYGTWTEYEVSLGSYTGNGRYIIFSSITSPSDNYSYPYLDDVTLEMIPTCPRPDSLMASNSTTNSVDLAWHDRAGASMWQIEYGPRGFEPGTGTPVIANSNPFTLTGIPAAYQGEYYVKAICSSTDTGNYSRYPAVFETSQIPATLPYNYDFEDVTEWNNWQTSTNSETANWYRGTDVADSGSYSMYIANGETGYFNYSFNAVVNAAAYRDIDFGPIDSSYTLSFRARVGGTTTASYDGLMVFLVDPSLSTEASDNGITSPWGNVNDLYRIATVRLDTTWQTYEASFDTIHGVHRVAFFWFNQNTGSSYTNIPQPAAVDNIHIKYSSCPRPLNLTATPTTNSAMLSWQGAANANYEITYRMVGDTVNQTVVTNTNSYNLTGLISPASYLFWVRKLCGVGDTSLYSDGLRFATLCTPITTFPWAEDFNSYPATGYNAAGSMPNACWDTYSDGSSTAYDPHVTNGGSSNYQYSPDNTNSIVMVSTSSAGDSYGKNVMIGLPQFGTPVSNLTFSFWYRYESTSYGVLEVGYMTGTEYPDDFVPVDTLPAISDNGTNDTVSFEGVPASATRIALRWTNPQTSTWYSVSLDNFEVNTNNFVPTCEAPAITSATATETTAIVTFESDADVNQVAIVEGNVIEDAFENVTAIDVADTFYTFNGLTASTEYTIGVRAVCGDELVSEWVLTHVTTDDHPCYTPTNVVVTDSNLNGGTITWTPGESIQTAFEVRVYNNTYDSTYTVQAATSLTVNGLYSATTYNVTVRAICGAGNYSDWTGSVQLNTTDCVAPTGVTATAEGRVVTVRWQSTGADRYRVAYFDEFTPADQATVVEVENGATTTTITVPEGDMSYSFFVYAYCGDALSNASDEVTVEILGIGNVNVSDVNLYPNPASTTVTVSGIEGESIVTVVDMNGRTVYTATATSDHTIDLSGMAKGAYFVRITGEQATAVRKLIVK